MFPFILKLKKKKSGLPDGLVVRIHLLALGTWDDPCSGKILHAAEDTEPRYALELALYNKRSHLQ